MADPSPPIRPKFNLGGQVSHYSSNPQIVTALNHETSTDDPEAGSKVKSSSNNIIENMSSNRNNRSLNPELLMREFTQDEQGRIDSLGVTDSPSACFQSQFAREVVQNTRKSSSILNLDLPSEPKSSASVHPAPALTHNHHNSNSQDNLQQTSSLNSNSNQQHRTRRNGSYLSSNNPKYRSQFAAKHHQAVQNDDDDSDSTSNDGHSRPSSLLKRTKSEVRSSTTHDHCTVDSEDEDENNTALWMTATQFSQMLDKQEATMDSQSVQQQPTNKQKLNKSSPVKTKTKSSSQNQNKNDLITTSFLDQEAMIPFKKLRQTCDDLGFSYTDKEWVQVRKMLESEIQKNTNQQHQGGGSSGGGGVQHSIPDDLMVRSEDFFSAIHAIMSIKQNRHRIEGKNLKHHPYSMKSDSGGEMESCRSSDSELERELAEKEREIQQRDQELTHCYRTIAERDTELIRVRLECQRLLEENREVKEQLKHIQSYTNPKKQVEMEKEIENLKWHLSIMENSRKSYESATQQLVSFLEHVTTMLQATSPSQRKLFEATKAQVLKTTGKSYKHSSSSSSSSITNNRFSLDANTMFRAESLPGLNMRGSLLSLSTNGGADTNSSVTSSSGGPSPHHLATMPRRQGSSSSSSSSSHRRRNVHRSQSTHSKRSPMPSLQESVTPDAADYVNTDMITQMIKQEIMSDAADEIQTSPVINSGDNTDQKTNIAVVTNNTVASAVVVPEISIKKEENHVCNIKIKDESKPIPAKLNQAKRSLSSVSSTRPPTGMKLDKASKLLGIDELQITNPPDSGRFSMNSPDKLEPLLKVEDRGKFKSLGDLHMEKGLPVVLVNQSNAEDMGADEEAKRSLYQSCRKMLKSAKKLLASDHKTLEITPVKSAPRQRSSLPGSQKQTLQLISHTTFPGLPTYPVLAASHSSPWNC